MQKLKCLCVHLTSRDEGKNIKIGFFSKENTETYGVWNRNLLTNTA